MKNIKLIFIFIIFILTSGCLPASVFATGGAASVSFSVPANARVGDTFPVLVNVDTGGVSINSVDIDVGYDQSLMSFTGYKGDNSVVKLWVQTPAEKNGTISMSGIIPGGASGLYDPTRKGLGPVPLIELLFTAKVAGSANISFVQSQILENDGNGTELEHNETNNNVPIGDASSAPFAGSDKSFDNTPPEPFTITFVGSSFFSSTPPMIVFNATDTGSGIKGYQVKIAGGGWQDAESPSPVPPNLFSRIIVVRATDFYGNVRDSSIVIRGILPTKVLLIILILLIFSSALGYKLLKYKA